MSKTSKGKAEAEKQITYNKEEYIKLSTRFCWNQKFNN
jgi:hypothetical protein